MNRPAEEARTAGSDDPYAPPRTPAGDETNRQRSMLREIVIGWEKLRVLYNLALLGPGVLVVMLYVSEGLMPLGAVLVSALLVGLGANAAFLLGPLVELYFRGLIRGGEPIGKGRWLIFSAGLVVSAGVFVLALLALFTV